MSAGIIALYLARSSQSIKLRGECGIRTIIGGGVDPVDVFSITVTNIGTRATVINNIGLSVGKRKKKRNGIITATKDLYSVGIPYPLADGQQGHWAYPLRENDGWVRELCNKFVQNEDDIESLRFYVHTNHGEVLTLKPEESLLKRLRKVLLDKTITTAPDA